MDLILKNDFYRILYLWKLYGFERVDLYCLQK